MRYITLALAALLMLVHAQLWFSKGGLHRVIDLNTKLETQKATNEAIRARNAQMAAEVRDLRDGLEMVEEKARFDLGMLRPREIFVQITAAPKS